MRPSKLVGEGQSETRGQRQFTCRVRAPSSFETHISRQIFRAVVLYSSTSVMLKWVKTLLQGDCVVFDQNVRGTFQSCCLPIGGECLETWGKDVVRHRLRGKAFTRKTARLSLQEASITVSLLRAWPCVDFDGLPSASTTIINIV